MLFKQVGRLIVLALVLMIPSIGPVSASARPLRSVTVWLDWYPNTDHVGLYVALAKGYYRRAGLEVHLQVPSGATDALQLLAHGNGDIGLSYEPSIFLARAQGVPVVATAALIQSPLNCILTLKSSGIRRPKELEGKTVGVAGLASDYTSLRAAVSHDGGLYAHVHTATIGYSLLQALLTKRVDAVEGVYRTWEALQAQQLGYKVTIMPVEKYGVPTYNELVFATSTTLAKSERATIRAFQNATFAGYYYAANHRAEAINDLLKAPGVLSTSRQLITTSLGVLTPLFRDASGHYGRINVRTWQNYANWMYSQHLVPHPIKVKDAVAQNLT